MSVTVRQVPTRTDPYDRTTLSGAARHLGRRVGGTPGTRHHALSLVWLTATLAFLVLDAAVTFGASRWRGSSLVAAWPAVQAAVRHWDQVAGALSDPGGGWVGAWHDLPAPSPDLDLGAALVQVAAATWGFGVVLGIALLLASRRRRALAVVAAVAAGVSVASMGGLLARMAPMVPVAPSTDPSRLDLDQFPAALRGPRIALDAALAANDTPAWWSWSLGVLVTLISLGAVAAVLRRGTAPAPIAGRAAPAGPALVVGALALLPALALDLEPWSSYPAQLALLGVTAALALAAAAVGAAERVAVAAYLSLGMVGAHLLLVAAFDRSGGSPGGWGVGSGGPQESGTLGSAAVLVAAPLAGWALARAWSALSGARGRRPAAPRAPAAATTA